ncbi:MAG: aldehyde ferredoxin oxidoreductase family protein [Deltaproteobacteria bacterium]|nr:aldehyde ferredoxin oxidoreductase family protein [Deltaproteobacteria bacterium]MBW2070058.1 aldehyde ferredoxin oxidoreductase family protein [Deltaproteobacteria bacterium]
MFGQYGRILKINVTDQSYHFENIEETIYSAYLGGKGLASYLLHLFNPPGIDPLHPDNCLIFSTGPFTGSKIWGGCRYGVFTKSPQTGLYAESYSGGKVPEAIDAAGYDAIIIQGKSEQPIVLEISPEAVKFHAAENLWGRETYETEDAVLIRYGSSEGRYRKTGAVVIGPAAENGVCFGVIKNDHWRSAGRTGVGTVLGAKKVKAVVFKGDRKRPLYDEEKVRAIARKMAAAAKDNPGVHAYKAMGTSQLVKIVNSANAFPTRYWAEGRFDKWENISADALHSRCEVKANACLRCFMACGRMTTVKHGRHAGLKLEGPEYETIFAFGGLCLVDSIEEIAYLNDLCDRLGMDTISAGNLCAFTIEARKRAKTDYEIDYGDVDGIAKLLTMIAYRDGIGDILARGIKYAAREWALEDIAVHVKGMEPAGYDPRVLKGMGLAFATSDRGACHLRTTFYKPELSGMIAPEQIEGKAELLVDFEDRLTIFDALILCRFYRDLYQWEILGETVQAVTGLSPDKEALRAIAASIANIVRRFNIREGLQPEDDWLPKKLFEKLEKTGQQLKREELAYMRKEYYRLRGWNEDGIPA